MVHHHLCTSVCFIKRTFKTNQTFTSWFFFLLLRSSLLLQNNSWKEMKKERQLLPSPQPSLTLLKGVLFRKKSMSVVEGSMEERSSSNLSPLTAKTREVLLFIASSFSSITFFSPIGFISLFYTRCKARPSSMTSVLLKHVQWLEPIGGSNQYFNYQVCTLWS